MGTQEPRDIWSKGFTDLTNVLEPLLKLALHSTRYILTMPQCSNSIFHKEFMSRPKNAQADRNNKCCHYPAQLRLTNPAWSCLVDLFSSAEMSTTWPGSSTSWSRGTFASKSKLEGPSMDPVSVASLFYLSLKLSSVGKKINVLIIAGLLQLTFFENLFQNWLLFCRSHSKWKRFFRCTCKWFLWHLMNE